VCVCVCVCVMGKRERGRICTAMHVCSTSDGVCHVRSNESGDCECLFTYMTLCGWVAGEGVQAAWPAVLAQLNDGTKPYNVADDNFSNRLGNCEVRPSPSGRAPVCLSACVCMCLCLSVCGYGCGRGVSAERRGLAALGFVWGGAYWEGTPALARTPRFVLRPNSARLAPSAAPA
jgi:hypothetical protein